MPLKAIKRDISLEANDLLNWLERGCWDALEKRFVNISSVQLITLQVDARYVYCFLYSSRRLSLVSTWTQTSLMSCNFISLSLSFDLPTSFLNYLTLIFLKRIESYTFGFSYPEADQWCITMPDQLKETYKIKSKKEIVAATADMLRRLVVLTQTLRVRECFF